MAKPFFSIGLVLLGVGSLWHISGVSEGAKVPTPDLELLASPAFEGRGIGTKGIDLARDHLAERLSGIGLTPAIPGRDGAPATFFQSLPVFIGNEQGPENRLSGLPQGEFIPFAFSRSGQALERELVFVGFGISARGEIEYDDYAGIDVAGKIVVALMGDPGSGNPRSPFRNPNLFHYSTPLYKVQNAERKGAAGVILVRDPLSLEGPEPSLQFQPRQGGGASVGILAVQARGVALEQWLDLNLLELQRRIASTQQPASKILEGKASLSVDLVRRVGTVQNVAGWIPGQDPNLSNQVVVIGAHYDHLGYGGDFSLDPQGNGKIHPGADDNASGVQSVLWLAERLKAERKNQRPILIVFFTAEESGLIGAKHFVENLPLQPGQKLVTMLNLDMVGRLDNNRLSVLALRSALEFSGIIEQANSQAGFDLVRSDSGFGSSDHAAFLQMKIPSLFFTTGAHLDYHRPSDSSEKINAPGMLRVTEFVYLVSSLIDANPQPPTYDPTSEEQDAPPRQGRGYGVYFGSIPEFEQGSVEGVLLQGVRPGSPAEAAGLRSRDILRALGEIQVRSLQDLVFALRFYRPNETVKVVWQREGVEMWANVTLRAREGSR
jgi:aminopeptidase YwaD